jgi:hypothetical protein
MRPEHFFNPAGFLASRHSAQQPLAKIQWVANAVLDKI